MIRARIARALRQLANRVSPFVIEIPVELDARLIAAGVKHEAREARAMASPRLISDEPIVVLSDDALGRLACAVELYLGAYRHFARCESYKTIQSVAELLAGSESVCVAALDGDDL